MTWGNGFPKPLKVPARFWQALSRETLQRMEMAGQEIHECLRVLNKTDGNVVREILRQSDTFYEWDHYPEGDVYDRETHAQYYYHAHRGAENEHGHFHTFLRRKGIPKTINPLPYDGEVKLPEGDDVLTHFVAISMDKRGIPTHLFTTNRWVTGENWFTATDVRAMLDRFIIDHAWPSWVTNRWITAMLTLFRPQIEALLEERDRVVADWKSNHPGEDVYEDRDLEVTSIAKISVDQQIRRVTRLLA